MIVYINRYTVEEMVKACRDMEERGFTCIKGITKKQPTGRKHFSKRLGKYDFKYTETNDLGYIAAYKREEEKNVERNEG